MREAGLRGGRARSVLKEVRNPMPRAVFPLRICSLVSLSKKKHGIPPIEGAIVRPRQLYLGDGRF